MSGGLSDSIHNPARDQPGPVETPQMTAPRANPLEALAGMTAEQLQAVAAALGVLGVKEKPHDIPTKTPEVFNGNLRRAREFLQDCELQFAVNPHKFKRDEDKVGYVLSFMTEGIARDFMMLQFRLYDAKGHWDLFSVFKDKFEKQFVTSDEKGAALTALTKLTMGDSADTYVGKFKLLALKAGITDEAMMKMHFIRGLNGKIKEWLIDQGIPDDFEGLCQVVQKRDARWKVIHQLPVRRDFQFQRNPFQGRPKPQIPWRRWDESMGEPMDIDAFQVRLAPEEIDRRRRLGLCFGCGQRGHLSRDCPKKTPSNGNGTRPGTNNPFRNQQPSARVAEVTSAPETKVLTVEERATQIATMLKGTDEENEKIHEMLKNQGFH